MRSCNKFNKLYLHLQKTHGYQTRQSADLPWEAHILKAIWPIWSRDQCEVMWQLQQILPSLSQDLWPLNFAGCWIMGGGLATKRLSCRQLLVQSRFSAYCLILVCKNYSTKGLRFHPCTVAPIYYLSRILKIIGYK